MERKRSEPIRDTDTVLWFGRDYKGLTIRQVMEEPGGPGFLLWASKKVDGFDLHYTIIEILEKEDKRTRWELVTQFYWSRYKEKEEVTS